MTIYITDPWDLSKEALQHVLNQRQADRASLRGRGAEKSVVPAHQTEHSELQQEETSDTNS